MTRTIKRWPVAALMIMVSLTACTPGGPVPPNNSSSSSPPSTSTGSSTDLRTRLAAALRAEAPTIAGWVERPRTTLTVMDTPWLANAQIVDVTNDELAHPRRVFVALGAEDIGFVLTGDPAAYGALLTSAQSEIASADVAVMVADTFLDTTRDFRRASYRIKGVDDIEWLTKPDAGQKAVRARVERAYETTIERPSATRQGDGWRVVEWMVYDHQLVRHDLTVTPQGQVSDDVTIAYDGLPVPDSY